MKTEIIEKLAALITAAFGLVAALAWNDAIKAIFKEIFGEQSTFIAMIVYALFVTCIAVIVTIYVGRAAEKAKKIDLINEEKLIQRIRKITAKEELKATKKKANKKTVKRRK